MKISMNQSIALTLAMMSFSAVSFAMGKPQKMEPQNPATPEAPYRWAQSSDGKYRCQDSAGNPGLNPSDSKATECLNLRGADLFDKAWININLKGSDFRGATISYFSFSHSDFTGANLGGVSIKAVQFDGAKLDGASLKGLDSQYQTVSGTYQPTNSFKAVSLIGADLSGASLAFDHLDGSDLSKANLSEANLSKASLRGVNLEGANLKGANLGYADLNGAILTNTIYDSSTKIPLSDERAKAAGMIKQ